MKFKFTHPDPTITEAAGPKYWRSMQEKANTEDVRAWIDQEFSNGSSEFDGFDRRNFLKLMGASFGLAGLGLSGCRSPEQKALPYSKQPEHLVPGVPLFFASSMPTPCDNVPLIIETHQSRPTKIEGNPSYGPYGGAANVIAQASILDLYDPDRSQENTALGGKKLSRAQVNDILDRLQSKMRERKGANVAFLAEPSTSVSRAHLVSSIRENFPLAIWAEYDPFENNAAPKALESLTGHWMQPVYNIQEAKRIVAIDSDFLNDEPGSIEYVRSFAKGRKVEDMAEAHEMNRLYSIESNFTVTGGMADHRLRLSSSQMPAFTALLAAIVLKKTNGDEGLATDLTRQAGNLQVDLEWIDACAQDLIDQKGHSLVIVGVQQSSAVHQLAYLINERIGAQGKIVQYLSSTKSLAVSISELSDAIKSKKIDTLVILGGNPAYNAPADLDWAALQTSVPEVIRLGYHFDETSKIANVHIASAHFLESWSDGRTLKGTVVPVQPMILPIFNGYCELEVLARVSGYPLLDPFDQVRANYFELASSLGSKQSFESWLSVGVLEGSEYSLISAPAVSISELKASISGKIFAPKELDMNHLEVRFVRSSQMGDGRYNNNGWLQECPDPMTKIVWDNAIIISPKLARELQASTGHQLLPSETVMNVIGQLQPDANVFKAGKESAVIAEIKVDGRSVRGPLYVLPGVADYSLIVSSGYGRTEVGQVGKGTGFSIYPLVTTEAPLYQMNAKLTLTPERMKIGNTQQHWSLEGRAIVREANVEEYDKHPDFAKHMCVEAHSPAILGPDKNKPLSEVVNNIPRGNSAYETPAFTDAQQWGMVIDLNSCTGCNACVIACQSENNVPIVGKDQVLRGREMHWIRIDRYFSSLPDDESVPNDPQVSFMGMACQHCELAPCESVCPVNATVHDDQGLNVMAYNRCVGTRYCANNCPYKVRRFNYFDWNKRQIGHFYEGPFGPAGVPELLKMQKNPDVTVRMRGVMEKCTFCVQRIEGAKINQLSKAKDSDDRHVPDGVIQTACQQTCPTQAISFGDIADPSTKVSRLKANERNYSVLGYLNTRPRTTYLAKLRNPNPLMPDYYHQPLTRRAYEQRYGHASKDAHAVAQH
jgi:MoCo/4Fe-4S cofactor protein with predicted Tat translocation signal